MFENLKITFDKAAAESRAEKLKNELNRNLDTAAGVVETLHDPECEKLVGEFSRLSRDRDNEFNQTLGERQDEAVIFAKFLAENGEKLGVYLTRKYAQLVDKGVDPTYESLALGSYDFDREFLTPDILEKVIPKLDEESFSFLVRRIEDNLRRDVTVFDRNIKEDGNYRGSYPARIANLRECLATALPFLPDGESKQMSEQLLRESERQ